MRFRYLFLSLVITAGYSFAAEKTEEPIDLDSFLSNYYLKPQPNKTGKFLKAYAATMEEHPSSQAPLLVFVARILQDNPQIKDELAAIINSTSQERKKALSVLLKMDHKSLLSRFEPSPARNDALWGSFFASGREEYLEELFSAAQEGRDLKDLNKYVIGGSAQWSICSNAKEHKRVREFLLLKSKETANKKLAEELLSEDPGSYRIRMIETIQKQREKGIW